MRKGSAIAGATLLYGHGQSAPDLLAAMQRLVDDLRADGRRISGLRYTAGTVRLRADPWDMVMTLADGPLPPQALGVLFRPPPLPDRPDFARVHLARMLQRHAHALGFLLRRRGALPPDAETAARALAREGQLCLIALQGADLPALVVWQPGGLVLTPDELRGADPQLLLTPRAMGVPLTLTPPERLGLARPPAVRSPAPEAASAPPNALAIAGPDPPLPDPPFEALVRVASSPGFVRASDRVTLALRGRAPAAAPKLSPRLLPRVAVAAVVLLWCLLLPDLAARVLPAL